MKQALSIFITLVLSTGAASARDSHERHTDTKPVEWVVQQEKNTFYIAPNAVRAVNLVDGFETIAKAPEWNVVCFKRDKKICWSRPLDKFSGNLFNKALTKSVDLKREPIFVRETVKNGFACAQYRTDNLTMYGSEQIKASPLSIEFINRYLATPTIEQVPIFLERPKINVDYKVREWTDFSRSTDFSTHKTFSTSSIKAKPYSAGDFVIPTGYKRVFDVKDITISDNKRKQYELMLEGVGFSTADKSRKEKSKD